jgi:WD40 repeat protein
MVFADHRGPLHRATFSPDGRRVLTAAADGTARLYVLPVGPADDWVAHAQSVAPRPLSDDERRRYA